MTYWVYLKIGSMLESLFFNVLTMENHMLIHDAEKNTIQVKNRTK